MNKKSENTDKSDKSDNKSNNPNKPTNPNNQKDNIVLQDDLNIVKSSNSNSSNSNNSNSNNFPKFKYKYSRNYKPHKRNRRNLQSQIAEDINSYNDNKNNNVQYFVTSNSFGCLDCLGDMEVATPIKLIKVNSISNTESINSNQIGLKRVNSNAEKIKEFKDNIRKKSSYNLLEGFINEITNIAPKNSNKFSALSTEDDELSPKKNNDIFLLEGIDIEEINDLNESKEIIPTYVSEKKIIENPQNEQKCKKNILKNIDNDNITIDSKEEKEYTKHNKKNKSSKQNKFDKYSEKLDSCFDTNVKNVSEIKDLEKKICDVSDYNLVHTPFKMIGEELLNEEINVKYRNKKQNNEYQVIIKKLKETFRKMVMGDIKEKPNLSKILLDNDLPEDVKLKILRKFIRYSTEDEVFSESADRIRLEINNLLKVKKIRTTNDYDEIWDQIESKVMPDKLKTKLEDMYYRIITGDETKLTNFVHNVLRLPYHKIPNTLDNISKPETPREEQIAFIKSIYKTLDDNLFGLSEVKDSIVSYICQRINNPETSTSKYLCLCGPAGVGKTSIVHAISEALKIPYSYISLANVDVPSTLIGHDYTYEGSTHGCIADALIKNECANGIILFDELDKCKEKIHNTLLGIFDPLQNCKFRDAYLGNFPIDLSQNLMIICLNDLEKINPILRDRLHIVHIPGYTNDEKRIIVSKYILPKLQIQYKIDIKIDKDVIDYIINNTSQHKGIRQLIMYLTKIYEMAVLDKFTCKFNLGDKFTLKDLSYVKIQEDSSSKVISSMYV